MGAVAGHASILPCPTQTRNSGRAEQCWIAGRGWVPRRGGLVSAIVLLNTKQLSLSYKDHSQPRDDPSRSPAPTGSQNL